LKRERIEAVVLKGPAIERWLFSTDEVRGYSDIDLLVPPASHEHVATKLRQLGYRDMSHDPLEDVPSPHARMFAPPDGAQTPSTG
jgi:hypothetical protein